MGSEMLRSLPNSPFAHGEKRMTKSRTEIEELPDGYLSLNESLYELLLNTIDFLSMSLM